MYHMDHIGLTYSMVGKSTQTIDERTFLRHFGEHLPCHYYSTLRLPTTTRNHQEPTTETR